jgi:hypothetical protein
MYFLEARGGSEGKKIGKEELYVLSEALKIRNNLGRFHRGALFDDWNIEDILSLLNFENMISGKSVRKDIDKMTEAISLTIELSNQIHFSGKYDNRRLREVNTIVALNALVSNYKELCIIYHYI